MALAVFPMFTSPVIRSFSWIVLLGKKGIVKDKGIHCRVIKDVIKFAKEDGFTLTKLTYSPITGGEGNIEFLGLFIKDGKDVEINIEDIVNAAHNCFER